MDSSESFLKTTVERVRAYMDDADFQAKYNDAYLVSHVIMPSLVDVQSRLALNASNNVLLKFNLSMVSGQESYVLPPCVGEILRVVKYNDLDNGLISLEWRPRGHFSVGGPIWILEGNMISFRPYPAQDDSVVIEYSSNGDMRPHYHDITTGLSDANNARLVTTTTFKFADTPTLGMRDKRLHAYAGQTLRLYGSIYHEERIISAYNASTRTATVNRPFTLSATTNYSYEACPPNSQAYVEAVTLASAIKLGTWRKVSQSHHALLVEQYRMAIKTITDNLSNMQARVGKSWQKDTPDNPDWRP